MSPVAGFEVRTADVVVVGSGVAGLSAALRLAESEAGLTVAVLSKSGLGDGSSRWAQGGIACAVGANDAPDLHAADTLGVAGGLGRAAIVRILTGEGPQRIARLIERGARFDRAADGSLELGLEGGHSRGRILHAGGDATGAEVMRALGDAARRSPALDLVERTRAVDLTTRDGRVTGLIAVGPGGHRIVYRTSAVIFATGGFGRAYLRTTNPPEATGDAIAMAARASAVLADMEFVQFHPTALDVGVEPMPLLTEALRGAGALLLDGRGRRFMESVSPRAELAPRDLVARTLWRKLAAGERVFLDARPALGRRPFPTAVDACRRHGLDPEHEPVPVSPAAHYTMGGIAVDASGRSSLEGLWVCGEAAGSGLHGANRLASNSLLEGLVFGSRVADDVARRVERATPGPIELPRTPPLPAVPDSAISETRLRTLLWERVGVVRTGHGLATALRELRRLGERTAPGSRDRDLVTIGLLVGTAALARRESRGAHYRRDFPESRPGWRRHLGLLTDSTGLEPRLLSAGDGRRVAGGWR